MPYPRVPRCCRRRERERTSPAPALRLLATAISFSSSVRARGDPVTKKGLRLHEYNTQQMRWCASTRHLDDGLPPRLNEREHIGDAGAVPTSSPYEQRELLFFIFCLFFFLLSLSLSHTHTHTYTGPRYCYFFLEEVLALPLVVLVSVAYALLCTLKPNIFGTYVEVGGDGRR